MKRRARVLGLWVLGTFLVVLVARRAIDLRDPYHAQMRPIYREISRGDQGWGGRATDLLHKFIASQSDRHALADRLLTEPDGSLVAEGMVLAVQSRHPRAREILTAHLTDTRWNWSLTLNDYLSTQLLRHLDAQPTEEWVRKWIRETEDAR